MKNHDTWEVLPHGDLEQLADNLYTVVGKLRMPVGETTRRMTVAKLSGNRLVIYSAIALDEARMAKLESLGTPTFLIVPSSIHCVDAKPWKTRYPQIQIVAPHGEREKIEDVVLVDAETDAINDPAVSVFEVPGTGRREIAMTVTSSTGKTLVLTDLIFNLPEYKGITGLGLKVLGFGPGHPQMPKLVKMRLVEDDAVVRDQLRSWAQDGFERILVAHGEPIQNPREALLQLASS